MPETPRTWTLEGDVVGTFLEPITRVSGPYVDISEKFEVVEKTLVDVERERLLDLLERIFCVETDAEETALDHEISATLREYGRLGKEES